MRKLRFSFSVGGPIASSVVEEGVEAERLGYDFVWVADHLSDIPPITAVFDAWTVLSYVGARTKRIMLAPGVTDIQRMHPAKMANVVATLDNLTGGRAVLGIGAGEVMNVVPYGMEWEAAGARVDRLREFLKVVQLLWGSSYLEPVDFDGNYYRLKRAHLGLSPVQKPRPPIYIGAFASPLMLGLVGEIADGWFPGAFYTPQSFAERTKIIREAAEKSGRTMREIDAIVNLPVAIGKNAALRRRAKEKLRRQLVLNKYMLRILGAEEAYEKVSRELQYQLIPPSVDYEKVLEKAVRELPIADDVLEKGVTEMMALGTVDECVSSIERFVKAGATHVHLSTVVSKMEECRAVARLILPHLRERGR